MAEVQKIVYIKVQCIPRMRCSTAPGFVEEREFFWSKEQATQIGKPFIALISPVLLFAFSVLQFYSGPDSLIVLIPAPLSSNPQTWREYSFSIDFHYLRGHCYHNL